MVYGPLKKRHFYLFNGHTFIKRKSSLSDDGSVVQQIGFITVKESEGKMKYII